LKFAWFEFLAPVLVWKLGKTK
jgi:hypothetical protein